VNPWSEDRLSQLRTMLRFGLWLFLIVHGVMLGLFSIAWMARFLVRAWGWCDRVLFSEQW
jgi:hypothetical protein